MARILLVDDDEVLVNTLSAIFRRLGHTFYAALDGATGLACARAASVDLVILDVMMPDMDGLEVCRALRQHPATSRTPVLMFTALDEDALQRRAGARGGDRVEEVLPDACLTKPVIVDELLERVRALLPAENAR